MATLAPWHVQTHHQNKESKDSDEDRGSRCRCVLSPWYVFVFFSIFTNYLQVAYTKHQHHHWHDKCTSPHIDRWHTKWQTASTTEQWRVRQHQWVRGRAMAMEGAWDATRLEAQVCFFFFLTTTYSTMCTTTTKPAWLLLCRMAKLYQTQKKKKTMADVVLHAGIFTLCFYSCFFKLNNILIFSSERRSTKADPSQQKYMHAYEGPRKPTQTHESQHRPMKANTDPWKPMQANKDPQKPTQAHESQHRPKGIYEGQQRQAWMITMDPM